MKIKQHTPEKQVSQRRNKKENRKHLDTNKIKTPHTKTYGTG